MCNILKRNWEGKAGLMAGSKIATPFVSEAFLEVHLPISILQNFVMINNVPEINFPILSLLRYSNDWKYLAVKSSSK